MTTYTPEHAQRLVAHWRMHGRTTATAAMALDMLAGKWVGYRSVRARGVDWPTFARTAAILEKAGYELEEAEMHNEFRYRVRLDGR